MKIISYWPIFTSGAILSIAVRSPLGSEATIKKVLLIHWDAPEARLRVERLESLGYAASYQNRAGPPLLRHLLADPPSAVVIDLSRLPAQGRDLGLALRANKATRSIPIVFVDGLPEKVLVVRTSLPDATFTTWTHLSEDLKKTLTRPARKVETPEPTEDAAPLGRSIAGKFGIGPNDVVALLGAPPGFDDALEPLPKNAALRRQMSDDCTHVLWFARSRRELQELLGLRTSRLGQARLWIMWPKKTTGKGGDLDQPSVADLARGHGLVGGKGISIDADWAGAGFSRDG